MKHGIYALILVSAALIAQVDDDAYDLLKRIENFVLTTELTAQDVLAINDVLHELTEYADMHEEDIEFKSNVLRVKDNFFRTLFKSNSNTLAVGSAYTALGGATNTTVVGSGAGVNGDSNANNRTALGANAQAIIDNGVVLGDNNTQYIYPGGDKTTDLGYPDSHIFNTLHTVALSTYDTNNNYVALTAPETGYTTTYTLYLPVNGGQPDVPIQLLTNDGFGNLSFTTTVFGSPCVLPSSLAGRNSGGNFVATAITLSGGSLINYGTSSCDVGVGFIWSPTLQNTFVGLNAGNAQLTTGTSNTALGYAALAQNTQGYNNVAIGAYALYGQTAPEASDNIAVGTHAQYSLVNGAYNTAIGTNALYSATFSYYNVALGCYALSNLVSGSGNVAVGHGALTTLTCGNFNTAFGYYADVSDPQAYNRTAIGYGAQAIIDNGVVIGDAQVTAIYPGGQNSTNLGFAPSNIFNTIQTDACAVYYNNTSLVGNSFYAAVTAPLAYETTYTLLMPVTIGSFGQALATDGNNPAQLSWVTPPSAYSENVPLAVVLRDLNGNFAATTVVLTTTVTNAPQVYIETAPGTASYTLQLPTSAGSLNQILTSNGENNPLTWQTTQAIATATIPFYGDVIGSASATVVNSICGLPSCTVAHVYQVVNNATPFNQPNTLVLRDQVAQFEATTITFTSDVLVNYATTQIPFILAPLNENTVIGLQANNGTSFNGLQNSVIGSYALESNRTGIGNSAFGYQAAALLATSSYTVACGAGSMSAATDPLNYSIALGYQALQNAIGEYNIAVGANALSTSFTGSHNTLIGYAAGIGAAPTAYYRTAIGNNITAIIDYGIALGGPENTVVYPGNNGLADLGYFITAGNSNNRIWARSSAQGLSLYNPAQESVTLLAPTALDNNYTLLLPTGTGLAGQLLATDGQNPAQLYWVSYNPEIFTGNLVGDVIGTQTHTEVKTICGIPACSYALSYSLALSLTTANSATTLALRDLNGSVNATNATLSALTLASGQNSVTIIPSPSGIYSYTLQLPTSAGAHAEVLINEGGNPVQLGWQPLDSSLLTQTVAFYGDVRGTNTSTIVVLLCGFNACDIVSTVTTATSSSLPGTLVIRDNESSFALSTLTLAGGPLVLTANGQSVAIEAVSGTTTYTLQLPTFAGLDNQILVSDGGNPAQLSWQNISTIATATTAFYGDVIGSASATIIQSICGQNACELANIILTATSSDIQNSLVLRDATGSFAATTLTLTGQSLIAYDTQGGYIYAPVYNNALIGLGAGNNGTLTGTAHVAFGTGALAQVTTQHSNVAIGYNTLSGASILSDNIAIGVNALASPSNSAGAQLAIGSNALAANTTGTYNSAIGYSALAANTSGAYNLALGPLALAHAAAQSDNIAIGYNTLAGASILSDNIAIGVNALASPSNSAGAQLAIGSNALAANTIGMYNSAIGYGALAANTSGAYNLALGPLALANTAAQSDNIAIGYNTLSGASILSDNIAIGVNALSSPHNRSQQQVAIGSNALAANTTGTQNVAIGYYALAGNTNGSQNTAVGYLAMSTGIPISGNSALGAFALQQCANASNNVAVGYYALQQGDNVSESVAIGYYALKGGIGSVAGPVMAIGSYAGVAGLNGYDTAIGYKALSGGSGGYNTCAGAYTLANGPGQYNVAVGYYAGNKLTGVACNNNTLVGYYAGANLLIGAAGNILIGGYAGSHLPAGVNNIIIASLVEPPATVAASLSGNTYINSYYTGLEDATIRIGNSNTTSCYIQGIYGSVIPGGELVYVNYSTGQLGKVVSSQRYKEQIEPLKSTGDYSFIYTTSSCDRYKIRHVNSEIGSIQPHQLPIFMLADQQKNHASLAEQDKTIAHLHAEVAGLELRLERLLAHKHLYRSGGSDTIAVGSNYQNLGNAINTTVVGSGATVADATGINRTALGCNANAVVDNGVVLGDSAIAYIYSGTTQAADLGLPPDNIFNTVDAVAYTLYDNNNQYAMLTAPVAYQSTYTLYLPVDQATVGQFLNTSGTSNLIWSSNLTIPVPQTPQNMPLSVVLRDTTGSFAATTITLTGNSLINYGYLSDCDTGSGFIFAPTNGSTRIGLNQVTCSMLTNSNNVTLGYSALTNGQGYNTIAIGAYALEQSTSLAHDNVAIGTQALQNNLVGCCNLAIGTDALLSATAGLGNIAIGQTALQNLMYGSGNIGFTSSLPTLTTGSYNSSLGYGADNLTPGDLNTTVLGFAAQPVSPYNNVVIGSSETISIYPGSNRATDLGFPPNNLCGTVQALQYSLYDNSNVTYAALSASPTQNYISSYTLMLPINQGAAGQLLSVDSANNTQLVWDTALDITNAYSADIPETLVLRDNTGSFAVTGLGLTFPTSNDSPQVTLQAGSSTITYTIQLPVSAGQPGQALSTDGNNPASLSWQLVLLPTSSTISLAGDVVGTATFTVIQSVCQVPACDFAATYSTVLLATSADIPLTLIMRDSTGSFAATSFTLDAESGGIYASGAPFIQTPAHGNTLIGVPVSTFLGPQKNSAVGSAALLHSGVGFDNSALGYNAISLPEFAYYNTALGNNALYGPIQASLNTAVGYNALQNSSNAYYNVALGSQAFAQPGTGYYSIGLGSETAFAGTGLTGYNRIAIGDGAVATVDYGMVLGSAALATVYPGVNLQADLGYVDPMGINTRLWATIYSLTTRLYTGAQNYAALAASPLQSYQLYMPTSAGSNSQVLTTNQEQQLIWVDYDPATFTGELAGDVIGTQDSTQVAVVCDVQACDLAYTTSLVLNSTSLPTPDSLVLRDTTGSIQATTITVTGALVLEYDSAKAGLAAASYGGTYQYTVQLPHDTGSSGLVLANNGQSSPGAPVELIWQSPSVITTSTLQLFGDLIGSTSASIVQTVCGIRACASVTTVTSQSSSNIPNSLMVRDNNGAATLTGVELNDLQFLSGASEINIQAASSTYTYTLQLPTTSGLLNQALTTNGTSPATLTWGYALVQTPAAFALSGDLVQSNTAAVVESICGQNACELVNIVITATSSDKQNSLVLRDATGSFAATTITLTGQSLIAYDTQDGYIYAPVYNNALIGLGTGNNGTLTGTANVAFGTGALAQVTTQHSNVAIGYNTLSGASILSDNIAIGVNALASPSNSAGAQLAIGSNALAANTTGTYNSAIGYSALAANTGGAYNLALGPLALAHAAAQSDNIAIGYNTLSGASILSDNIAIGVNALASPSNSAGAQLAIGSNALAANTTGTHNSAIGYGALAANTSGAYNLALGPLALAHAAAQNDNIAIGYNTLSGPSILSDNIAIGVNALSSPHNTSHQQIAIGSNALAANTTGQQNVALGYNALAGNSTGYGNTAVGYANLQNNLTGHGNTACGYLAFQGDVDASRNTALGYNPLAGGADTVSLITLFPYAATSANYSVALNGLLNDYSVQIGNIVSGVGGNYSVALGGASSTPANSVVLGYGTGSTNLAALNNVIVNSGVQPPQSGSYNILFNQKPAIVGSFNVVIGFSGSDLIAVTCNNTTNIGWGSVGSSDSNTIKIGCLVDGANACYIQGIYGVPISGETVEQVFVTSSNQVGGPAPQQFPLLVDDVQKVSSLYTLRPVQFNYIQDPDKWFEAGLIAEEVEQVMPELVLYKDGQPEGVDYNNLLPLMFAAQRQEHEKLLVQQQTITQLTEKIRILKEKIDSLQLKENAL